MIVRAGVALLLASAVYAAPGGAQSLTRPTVPWETITTPRFRFHYPAEMREWVQPIAERMEGYADAVQALVGAGPSSRVTVMVEDPVNAANGFAVPLLGEPTIFLWPTPPAPGPTFGTHRGWGEILAVHEYAHIAHLTIPTRNPTERLLWRLLPARVGPVARKAPAWVIEGYATLIEGRLTGNGRPASAGRAAVLRQWALEGQLPRYQELGATSPFLGGAMRYLVGSAFLEWLAERKGDESLQHLWRRMSARQQRSFVEAFGGVYGAPPAEMYGVFFTEVMEKALEARRDLRAAGLVQGALVQRLAWGTDEPAVSRDGAHVAVVVRRPSAPSRVVIWKAEAESDSGVANARRRMLERDSLDVAPFDSFPRPRRAIATLHPDRGRGHEAPRWFADGERLLVTRDEPLGDGTSRPDVFVWTHATGELRRVTRGAGIRAADPAPDGRWAVGVQCHAGSCDVVRIDVASGAMSTIAAGSPDVVWHRARVSPDGRQIAASMQRDGRWDVAVIDAQGGGVRMVGPEGEASRHSPAWTSDGHLVVVSEASGVPNLERLDPATRGTVPLTRVTGAASKPDVGPDGSVWYLVLHARGQDLYRLPAASASLVLTPLDPLLAPVAPPRPTAGMSFPVAPTSRPAPYGLGPRGWRVLPGISGGPDGEGARLVLVNADPVGRWTNLIQGAYGQRGAWRGTSAASALRLLPVQVTAGLWYAEHMASRQRVGSLASAPPDTRLTGADLWMHASRSYAAWGGMLRAGGTFARVDAGPLRDAPRALGFGEAQLHAVWQRGDLRMVPSLQAQLSQGTTDGDSWTRAVMTGRLSLGTGNRLLAVDGLAGRVTSARADEPGRAFEAFTVGGSPSPLFDPAVLSQRVALHAVPAGVAAGDRIQVLRLSARLTGFTTYATFAGAGKGRIDRYHRVYGLEDDLRFPGIGFARLPETHVRFGAGYSLDAPFAHRLRPYVSVTYRP